MATQLQKRKRKRKRKLTVESDETNMSKKRRLNGDKTDTNTNGRHCIEKEIKSWIGEKRKQSNLLNAQKCCVFVSTDSYFGSGICIDSKGIILTAKHCIGDNIQISFPDSHGRASVSYNNCQSIGMSDKYDLALIQIYCGDHDNTDNDIEEQKQFKSIPFPVAKVATKAIKKQEAIYIIGHPANSKRLNQTKSASQQNICGGKIVTLPSKKALLKEQNIMGGIKHNCVTFGGHSGAPLLNTNGEIVGIHVTCDNFEGTAITQQAIQQFINEWI
eukprot:225142_1